jgi:hypothetical protein
MVLAVIVHEVEKPNLRRSTLSNQGKFFDWFNETNLFASVGLRQFGQGSSGLLRNARVFLAPEMPGQMMCLISNGKKLNLLCHVVFSDSISDAKLNDLRRPGLALTGSLASSIGLNLKSDLNVYSTMASMQSDLTTEGVASNGWIVFEESKTENSVLLATLLLTSVCVAVERSILNEAQALTASESRNLFLYQPILHRLRAWSALPPIDNTYLATKYLALRSSLHLGFRRDETIKSLELKERNLAVLLGLTLAALGVVATFIASKV